MLSYFDGLISKVQGKLSEWKCEMLSWAIRKVLLQSMLLDLPKFVLANSGFCKSALDAHDKEFRQFSCRQE